MLRQNQNDRELSRQAFSKQKLTGVNNIDEIRLSLAEKIILIAFLSVSGVYLGINWGVPGITLFLILRGMICFSLAQNKYVSAPRKERVGIDNALWMPLGIILWLFCSALPLWVGSDTFWQALYINPDIYVSSSIIERLVSSGTINGLSLIPGSGFGLPLDYSTRVRIASIGISSLVIPICLTAGTLKHAQNIRYYINKNRVPKLSFSLKVLMVAPFILYAFHTPVPLTSLSTLPGINILGVGLYPWLTLFFCTLYSASLFQVFEFIRRRESININ